MGTYSHEDAMTTQNILVGTRTEKNLLGKFKFKNYFKLTHVAQHADICEHETETLHCVEDFAMDQEASHGSLTMERVRSHVTPCGVCGGKK